MSYEAEVLTYQPIGSDKKAPTIDRIGAMAKSARTRMSVQIYEDGTSDWTMEKLTPKRNTLMKDLTPPNPMPQTQKTRVLRDGTGYFYDGQGKLLHTNPVPIQSFMPVLSRMKKDPTAANAVIGVKSTQEVMALVATAKQQGSIVQYLGNNVMSVRSTVRSANRNARGGFANYAQVDILNTKLGIVLGSSLYNEANELVCQTFYRYKLNDDKNKLIPQVIHTKQWDTNSRTNLRVETINNTQFDNIVIKNNQG
ncbi:hypothetical protein [Fibrivirga algicola]|uniref:Uncharacterized protein n=1 Tax=Fibrivirga algicola TaxID=2950420 RepID=A0ABX0QRP2_9BACT|nr:hypothetical protein [Fibrivirga algicola]NID13423.1 hypothetical protein [Fibrivirga algicola]